MDGCGQEGNKGIVLGQLLNIMQASFPPLRGKEAQQGDFGGWKTKEQTWLEDEKFDYTVILDEEENEKATNTDDREL